ncbi:hypothetical protein EST38_g2075 [Candolleomyces aberdarensis]|uniref:Uncharacterized protein n=1 Tax=Candolleomyces aberdarensis TaxID=2316362 RepID=A0A4Q2DTU3_9AGAR|nr:hypothetical protein EST38_g2075 [Candolleomyces aberdarensis]
MHVQKQPGASQLHELSLLGRPTYEAAQQTLREFSIICDDFSLDMLAVKTTTSTSASTSNDELPLPILVNPALYSRYRRPKSFQSILIQC